MNGCLPACADCRQIVLVFVAADERPGRIDVEALADHAKLRCFPFAQRDMIKKIQRRHVNVMSGEQLA